MLEVTDGRTGERVVLTGRALHLAAGAPDPGTLLATDTLRRAAQVTGLRVWLGGVPTGWEDLNVHPGEDPGPADVVVVRAADLGGPPYGLGHRLAWLAGVPLADAEQELARWRALVAGWAEAPSKPMCAQVQEDLLAALSDDLATARAVDALRGSLDLGLPDGSLFETWAWADRLLGLDLAADVGKG
ncbi:MAG TPA: hypothetical protein VL281_12820 [Mycobacteriales bacterium]|nr:hypothetical protein [Mycobacteriales bacterium]